MSQPGLEMSWRMRTFQKKGKQTVRMEKTMANDDEHVQESKFKWSDKLVNDLLNALSNFKSTMEFKSKDFNADKPRQYEEVRKEIVRIDSVMKTLDQLTYLLFQVILMMKMKSS